MGQGSIMKTTTAAILATAVLAGCGDGCGDAGGENNGQNNGGDAGVDVQDNGNDAGNNGGSGENLLSVTLPPQPGQFGPYTIAAGTPVRIPLSFSLPSDVDAGEVVQFALDIGQTAEVMTIERTDGGDSPEPTVRFRFGAVAGADADAACDASPAVDLTITGNADFSEKTATDDGAGLSALRDADDGSNSFSACLQIESSVNVEITPAVVVDLEVDAGCDDAPEAVAGMWSGSYVCSDTCNPDQEPGMVTLSILQAGETAIYFDDGGAFYFGSVCGPSFRFVGGHPTYSEWGVFTRTGETTATKESTWSSSLGDNCGGDCSDDLTLQ